MMATRSDVTRCNGPVKTATSGVCRSHRGEPAIVGDRATIRGVILLLRHGEAEPDQGSGDAARRLTEKGETQAVNAGRAIARIGLDVDSCLTSPRVRARDTAELACEALGIQPEISEPIGSGDYDTLDLVAGRDNVMLVGHEPALSMETARLTGATIKLKKGGLAGFDRGVLKLLLRPVELTAIAG
jgi:phosphohistidine phosphatase